MQKTTVYEFMFKENTNVQYFRNPADKAEDYENEKNNVEW